MKTTYITVPPKQHCNGRNSAESKFKALKIRCNVAGGTNCLTRLIATVPEEFFLASFLKWLPQIRFASISTPERFWGLYWFTAGSTIDVQNERCS